MQLNHSYLQASRPILVPPNNTEEIQTLYRNLLQVSGIHYKYILSGQYTGDRINRYIECVLECYPDKYVDNFDDYRYPHRPSIKLQEHKDEITNWINDKQSRGFVVTWHNE